MKSILFAWMFTSLLAFGASEEKWVWQSPLPQGNDLHAVYFTSLDTGYAAGYGGAIIKTIDGGVNWTTSFLNPNAQFFNVRFWDTNNGIVIGSDFDQENNTLSSAAYKTADGGRSWNKLDVGTASPLFLSQVVTPRVAYIAGERVIYKSMDGGDSWAPVSLDSTVYLASISFINEDTGFVMGGTLNPLQMNLYKTVNGGKNWQLTMPLKTEFQYHCVKFLDAGNGFMGGFDPKKNGGVGKGFIQTTINGGLDWVDAKLPDSASEAIESLVFFNARSGLAFGTKGLILKTLDGGGSWTIQSRPPNDLTSNGSYFDSNFKIDMQSDQIGYGVGESGRIMKTSDGGRTWTKLSHGLDFGNTFLSVFFIDSRLGYVAGSDDGTGRAEILKSTDGGVHWDTLFKSEGKGALFSIHFKDADSGFAVGDSGVILRTGDGGKNWNPCNRPTLAPLVSVQRTSGGIGYAIGNSGEILKTNTGGDSWSVLQSNENHTLGSILFLDENKGFVVGGNTDTSRHSQGLVLKTMDGGLSWDSQMVGLEPLVSIVFPKPKIGYALSSFGTIFKSTNEGVSWTQMPAIPTPHFGPHFFSMQFIDSDTGYVSGNNDVFSTTDGGNHWTPQYVPMYRPIRSMVFPDRTTGYAVGPGGAVLKLSRNLSVRIASGKHLMEDVDFGPNGVFHYFLSGSSRVTVKLFGLDGKLILNVLDRVQSAGMHTERLPDVFKGKGEYLVNFRSVGLHKAMRAVRL